MKRPLVAVPGETLSGDGRAEAGGDPASVRRALSRGWRREAGRPPGSQLPTEPSVPEEGQPPTTRRLARGVQGSKTPDGQEGRGRHALTYGVFKLLFIEAKFT